MGMLVRRVLNFLLLQVLNLTVSAHVSVRSVTVTDDGRRDVLLHVTEEQRPRRHDRLAAMVVAHKAVSRGPLGSWRSERLRGLPSRERGWAAAVVIRGGMKQDPYGFGGRETLRCAYALPPPGIPPVGWDLGVGAACLAASVMWVKLWTSLARMEKIPSQVSRKVVHATAAPLFMVLWPFFTSRPSARLFAAGVPLIQAARLTAAGLSGDKTRGDTSRNELVKGISRSGRASETLGGPLKYALVLTALTAVGWRGSVVGIVALMQLAVGDGMADLVGRRFGSHKWRLGGKKSIEGSATFVSSAFLSSMAMVAWFHCTGVLPISPAESAARIAGISFACAAVELLPPAMVGDDNLSVPVVAVLAGRLLFRSASGGASGV